MSFFKRESYTGIPLYSRGNAAYFLIKTNEDFKIIYISAKLDGYINRINQFSIKC
jgi:hypothetical protein